MLEKKNHRVDSEGREIKDGMAFIYGEETNIKYKINKEEDIWEYYKGFPEEFIGEQLFTWGAVKRLGLERRLPKYKDFENINKYNFYFPGHWNPDNKRFNFIGDRTDCWLSDGSNIDINKDGINHTNDSHAYGFSLRLLQGLDNSSIGQFSTDELFDEMKRRMILQLKK